MAVSTEGQTSGTNALQSLLNEQKFDRDCERLAAMFFEARRPLKDALLAVESDWLELVHYCNHPEPGEITRVNRQLALTAIDCGRHIRECGIASTVQAIQPLARGQISLFLTLIQSGATDDVIAIETLIANVPDLLDRVDPYESTEAVADEILGIWKDHVRANWRAKVQLVATDLSIDVVSHFSYKHERSRANKEARGFIRALGFGQNTAESKAASVPSDIVEVQNPMAAFLTEWTKNSTLAGKFISGWEELAATCRDWHVALNGSEVYLPIIKDLFNRLTRSECTEDSLVSYLFSVHGIKPEDARQMQLERLAELLRDGETTSSNDGATKLPDGAQMPINGPAMAKALVAEALCNDPRGYIADGTKLTVKEIQRRLEAAGVTLSGRSALYENQEYADVRQLAQPLGLFVSLPSKRNPTDAVRRGSKDKFTGRVETPDHREPPPDQVAR